MVTVDAVDIGQFAVTNAEWLSFVVAGGYEDERWWDTAAGRAWCRGVGTSAGAKADVRFKREMYLSDPTLLEMQFRIGVFGDELYERWQRRLRMSEGELTAHLDALYPDVPFRVPRYWDNARYNQPCQPVTGICWHEARAYCAWLSAQVGQWVRLPTEVEWEAAARGMAGRTYPWGDGLDVQRANLVTTCIRRATPVGVFPHGDTPDGVSDLGGNTFAWTSSAWGMHFGVDADFGYPYDAHDGREAAEASPDMIRIVRGAAFSHHPIAARAIMREGFHPAERDHNLGLRLVVSRT